MKYNVLVDGKIANFTGPVSLDEATNMVKKIAVKLTVNIHIANKKGDEVFLSKNVNARDSIKIVEVQDGQ